MYEIPILQFEYVKTKLLHHQLVEIDNIWALNTFNILIVPTLFLLCNLVGIDMYYSTA